MICFGIFVRIIIELKSYMSQLDLVQFFPTLVWSVVCFVVFYFVFNVFYVMVYYKNMRMRG